MNIVKSILLAVCLMLATPALKAQETSMEQNLNEVAEFLKECHVFYIATVEGNQPRVRPFGVAEIVDDKLYLTTGRKKDVYKQIEANEGRFEICAQNKGEWLRISGRLVDDDNAEVRQTILDRHKYLTRMYSANDGNFVTPYIAGGEARFCSFNGEERRVKF